MADSADDRGGHATTSARRERVDSVRPFRFELRLSHNPWRVVPAPTDGRAARRRPAAASNAPAHAGRRRPRGCASVQFARAFRSVPDARSHTPEISRNLNPLLSRTSAQRVPTTDDDRVLATTTPRWANVGRWRHHSKLAPFFKRRKIQQRLRRGGKMLQPP